MATTFRSTTELHLERSLRLAIERQRMLEHLERPYRIQVNSELSVAYSRFERSLPVTVADPRARLTRIKDKARTALALRRLRKDVRKAYRDGYKTLLASLTEAAQLEADLEALTIERLLPKPVLERLGVRRLNQAQVRQSVTQAEILGQRIRGRVGELASSHYKILEGIVRDGQQAGATREAIVARLSSAKRGGGVARARSRLSNLLRTSLTAVSATVRERVYRANKQIIAGVLYVAVLDGRTTDICRSLNGNIYPPFKGPRPPMHHNCRSDVVPIYQGHDEMPIPSRALSPEQKQRLGGPGLKKPEIPGLNTFLKRQDRSFLRRALGRKKASTFEADPLASIDVFRDDRGLKPLTPAAIRRIYGL